MPVESGGTEDLHVQQAVCQAVQRRRWRDDSGSMLVETALAVAVVLAVALPFASLVGYATAASRDVAATHAAARDAARGGQLSAAGITYACGATTDPTGPCIAPLARGTYVAARKDTPVGMPFGISIGTAAKAIARVE